MSAKLDTAIAVIGIDIGKNSFHVVGQAWRDSVAAEVVAWAGRNAARQPVTLPDRHGGLRRGASPQPEAAAARARYPIDAGDVRAALFEGTEENVPPREHCSRICKVFTSVFLHGNI